jgi:hypothetical protein
MWRMDRLSVGIWILCQWRTPPLITIAWKMAIKSWSAAIAISTHFPRPVTIATSAWTALRECDTN